jgi:hypothetical protein
MRGVKNNLTGKTFGHWEVEGFSCTDKRHNAKFVCRCKGCGKRYDVYGLALLSGKSTKCVRCAVIERIYGYARAF